MRSEPAHETAIVVEPSEARISVNLTSLARFRAWVHSDDFPEEGRIDWIAGEMSVDMSAEEANTHGSPKAAIARGMIELVEDRERGQVYVDRMRIHVPGADLSAEPDVVALLYSSVNAGRARLAPSVTGKEEHSIEIEGPPNVVVECVSESSVAKDTKKLFAAYQKAGVPEYWLVDARSEVPKLTLYYRVRGRYREARQERGGFLPSQVLGVLVRLVRKRAVRRGYVTYKLEYKPLAGKPRRGL